jgi:flagellar hook-associated protein 2
VCVGGFKNSEFLKGDLNCHGKFAHAAFIYLGGSVENYEESEKQGDEIRITDHTAIKDINSQYLVNPDGSGGGPLGADGSLREAQQLLLSAISYSTSGSNGPVNLATLGIDMNNDGTLSVNASALSTALASHHADLQNFFQAATTGFAANMNTVLTNLTDPKKGILGADGASLTQSYHGLSQQILDLQAALSVKQKSLTAIYAQVNTTLQELPLLQAQMSQQLGSLP